MSPYGEGQLLVGVYRVFPPWQMSSPATTFKRKHHLFFAKHDAISGVKLNEQKIKHNSDIKEYPIETLGAANQLAWLYVGEPMAVDPYTLEKKADIAILESNTPLLKDKFPKEKRYYEFNRPNGTRFQSRI